MMPLRILWGRLSLEPFVTGVSREARGLKGDV
jgi:hypothetical protein